MKNLKKLASPDYEAMAETCRSVAHTLRRKFEPVPGSMYTREADELDAAARTLRALARAPSEVADELEKMVLRGECSKSETVLEAATLLRSSPDLSAVRAEARREAEKERDDAIGRAWETICTWLDTHKEEAVKLLSDETGRLEKERDEARRMLLQCAKTRTEYQEERDVAVAELNEFTAKLIDIIAEQRTFARRDAIGEAIACCDGWPQGEPFAERIRALSPAAESKPKGG